MSSSGTPSPSPPPAHHSPSAPFYFPGPSSRYNHTRPRPKAHHARPKSTYIPVGPVLSTEKRAHRRAHTQKSSISSVQSSSASEYSRSPLSRFSSYSANMAAHSASAMPHTPAKTSRRSSSLQNSPFSDYFTDEARSVDTHVNSSETKQLLVRMNKLQSQLMRDNSESGREALNIVGRKLNEIEVELNARHSQTRLDIEDSGVFMDDERDRGVSKEDATPNGQQFQEAYDLNASMDMSEEPVTIEQFKAERDFFIVHMQHLLEGLNKARVELSQRCAEVRELNESFNAQIEDRETQLEQLRSENEGLRSDLGFEYSELLFLKLQMKSLEVDVDALSGDEVYPVTAAEKAKSAKKNRILSEMDRWRSDWQDVDARFKRRRSKYGVSTDRRDSVSVSEPGASTSEEADWHLETVKEGRGRVTSLTIKRMGSSGGPVARDVTAEEAPTLPREIAAEAGAPQLQHSPSSSPTTTDGLDGHQIPNATTTQGPSEPQIAPSSPTPNPPCTYQEHGTQTDFPLLLSESEIPTSQDEEEEDEELFEEEETEKEQDQEEEEDCAITTSSEDEASDEEEAIDVEEEDDDFVLDHPVVPVRQRTAWQELWSSLANLSGLPDDDDE